MLITIIISILIVLFFLWLIVLRNRFNILRKNIERCRSQVVAAGNSLDNRYSSAIAGAGKFATNEARANGWQGIYALGQQRDLQSSTGWNTNESQEVYDKAFTELRDVITIYNMEISTFPKNIAATIWGYSEEPLPDADKMIEESVNTRTSRKVNDESFL